MKTNPSPPRWAEKILAWLCDPYLYESMQGDLYELFERRVQQKGIKAARRAYCWDMLTMMRPSALHMRRYPRDSHHIFNPNTMFFHYLKTISRNLVKNRLHTAINVLGLSLGIGSALVIFLLLKHELSYDQYHPDKDRIYRITIQENEYGETTWQGGVPYPLVPAFKADFPEMDAISIVDGGLYDLVFYIDKGNTEPAKFKIEKGIAFVQPDYFKMFHYEWISGNAEQAFKNPYSIVVSESEAERMFGTIDVVGNIIDYNHEYDLTITGVVKDVPPNTELPFNLLITFDLSKEHDRSNEHWGSISSATHCFVKAPRGMDVSQLDARLVEFVEKHTQDSDEKIVHLQPLTEAHFDQEIEGFEGKSMDKSTIWSLGLVGIFLLATACINFVNLNTVLVFRRAKEIGLRRVFGSREGSIVSYFLVETAITTLIAIIVSLVALPFALSYLEPYIEQDLSFYIFQDASLALFVLSLAGLVVLMAGLYPAFLLSRLDPVMALKNKIEERYGKRINLRRGLVVAQFAISQTLTIIMLGMMSQMQYFHSVPMGIDKEAVVEFFLPDSDPGKLQRLKTELLSSPDIAYATFSNSGAASNSTWNSNFKFFASTDSVVENNTQVKFVDEDYLHAYGISLLTGDSLRANPTDTVKHMHVNETFARLMGYENPADVIGKNVWTWGREAPIVGVLKDFNTVSLRDPIEPVVVMIENEELFYFGAVKLKRVTPELLRFVERAWHHSYPDRVYEFEFLDEKIADFYKDEQVAYQMFKVFALLAILIGGIGLFGLVSYMAAQRTKEIGVRKVLGASIGDILTMFSKEFVGLVVVGFVFAIPIAWYLLDWWLQSYSYRVELGFSLYLIAIVATLAFVIATVGLKAYRAATTNPVEALRNE